ncbi:MAG: hypothetical protein DWQ04_18915 [Chloroflexi bacterium]|nr:MAG: hypothetical protein DWQ04_18915 [Chloroflexota bacterium]
MKVINRINFHNLPIKHKEQGQSIVLIALILVALLLFVGIAVDVGFIFARGSQLQAAVDSAALSGVSELILAADQFETGPADIKAGQFLNANGVPITNTDGITVTFASGRALTPLGVTEYSITVTWPIELFFLRLIRDDPVDLTRSATAGVSVLTDIYASRRVQDGTVSTSTQGIFGPHVCTRFGDPFSPNSSPWEPDSYTYRYRIMIPKEYTHDVVRVELFDPDSVNNDENNFTLQRSSFAIIDGGMNPTDDRFCGSPNPEIEVPPGEDPVPRPQQAMQRNPCVFETEEYLLVEDGLATIDQVNPFWYMRIDENRGVGGGNGNGECNPPLAPGEDPPPYNPSYNTQTLFQLYYFRQTTDGRPFRENIASYYGNTGDARDVFGYHDTDLRWVSPGADKQGNDYPDAPGVVEIPTVEGDTSFEVNLNSIDNIMVDASSGARYLWLDVTSVSGASENGFEIWAGPDSYVDTSATNVNTRNLAALNTPGSHDSDGVVIFALGRLPLNSVYENAVDIPLLYVGPEQAGSTLTISLFDTDSGADAPITFFFDTINQSDWSMTFSDPGKDDPDGVADGVRCAIDNNGCNNLWITPPYQITIPGDLTNCDYGNPTQENCTPFYGGRVMVNYNGGQYDSYGWQIQLSGLPYLIR